MADVENNKKYSCKYFREKLCLESSNAMERLYSIFLIFLIFICNESTVLFLPAFVLKLD